jgi:hypothetical protein
MVFREQQAAIGWSVVAGKSGELLLEILEAEVDAE